MTLSYTEENYLKSIYHLGSETMHVNTSTNSIAEYLTIKPATVTSMLKKLREKKLISYERYGKVSLTKKGNELALKIIRKHRLWEVFLVEKLHFQWDEVHEVAEQLEHIQSEKLTDKLDAFLNFPDYDPHGDPIPDTQGRIKVISNTTLSEAETGKTYTIVAVKDSSSEFLNYLKQLNISLSTSVRVVQTIAFDRSMVISVHKKEFTVSEKFASNLLIR